MRRADLVRLVAARAAKQPAVLAIYLKSDRSHVLYPFEKKKINDIDSRLVEAARTAAKADRSTTVETADGPVFLNVFNPPLRLAIVGAVHITQALAPIAALAGYDVLIVDPRRAFASAYRFPGVQLSSAWPDEAMAAFKPDSRSALVTLTHDPKLDDPALVAALRSDAFYIGALGSKKTHGARLERLRREGFGEADMARIHGPVGLGIGARSPAEIAVAIMAQMVQALRQDRAVEAAT